MHRYHKKGMLFGYFMGAMRHFLQMRGVSFVNMYEKTKDKICLRFIVENERDCMI